jgi:hypothetical protein
VSEPGFLRKSERPTKVIGLPPRVNATDPQPAPPFHAYEIEGHGYCWELFAPDGEYVDTVEPADGGGYVGRNECIDRAVRARGGPVIGGPTVVFHTFADWERENP